MSELAAVFADLRRILAPYAARLDVNRDDGRELYDAVSPDLKARMQGKSCFNFKTSEPVFFRELSALTKSAFASFEDQGFV